MRSPLLAALAALAALALSCTKEPAVAPAVAPAAGAAVVPVPTPVEEEVPDVRATAADRACSADAECTLVPEDCCGCTALGKQTAVRSDRLAALAKRRHPICASIACGQSLSDDATCAASKAACRAGVCVPDTPAARGTVPTEPIPPG